MTDSLYLERLKQLSTRLVSLQKPIRILDAIKWPPGIEQGFRACEGRELPALPEVGRPLRAGGIGVRPHIVDGWCAKRTSLSLIDTPYQQRRRNAAACS